MRYAAERHLADSLEELREIADGRDDIIAETDGLMAGSWCAIPEWQNPLHCAPSVG